MSKLKLEHLEDLELRWKNKKFEELAANVQGYVRQKLEIPQEYSPALLLHPRTSAINLAYTKIPPLCRNEEDYIIPEGHKFFTATPPSIDISILPTLLVPPPKIVADLIKRSKDEWLGGAESLHIPGDEIRLPVWVLEYWIHICVILYPWHVVWHRGLDWLQHEKFSPFPSQVKAALDALKTLSWSGDISIGSKAVSNSQDLLSKRISFPKSTLATYLSQSWLTDEHIDQMIYLLQNDVQTKLGNQVIRFINTIHLRAILQAYSQDQSGAEDKGMGLSDKEIEGIKEFKYQHICNSICKEWELPQLYSEKPEEGNMYYKDSRPALALGSSNQSTEENKVQIIS
ncbi:hypothetical protein BDN70DRAFT_932879 [Pholiota conissans]|uniref:Alpha-type protein kinase domain-containing protein n=1 Tax=Pholiota conissans TaxID=109636 RepID=A0A9P6CT70_9AGAR|nr:hypothetical protein BDN70DRAFT_932879 [Pholiota conissans]